MKNNFKNILFMGIYFILFFVFLEFISAYYFYNLNGFKGSSSLNFISSFFNKKDVVISQTGLKKEIILKQVNPFISNPPDNAHIRFHPFLDYSHAHGMNSERKVVTTKFSDFFGFRNKNNIYLEHSNNNNFIILMTGGSECAGYSHPTETISEYIQKKLLDVTKLEIKVINMCMNSYVLAHEIQAYIHLMYNLKPNLVISHSGWNDVLYGFLLDENFVNTGLIYNKWIEKWMKNLYGSVKKETKFAFQNFKKSNIDIIVKSYWKQAQKYNNLVEKNEGKFLIGLQGMNPNIVKDSMFELHNFTHKGMKLIKNNKPSNIHMIDFTENKNLEFLDSCHTYEKSVPFLGDQYLKFIKDQFPNIFKN